MSSQGDLFGSPVAAPASLPPVKVAPKVEVDVPQGPPSVMLIDASGFVFRAYHALPSLTTSKGVVTHAVLGFTRMLFKLLRERKPTHLALCFDRDSRKGRLAIDPNYKANREAPPPDLASQFDLIRKVAGLLNVAMIEAPGWEADDVIATMVDKARAEKFHVEIITSDKDFLQLLAPDVTIYDAMKDKNLVEADAREKFGINPNQMRDYQALVGDAIDNIPKVPGIGPKTASELLQKFGTIDNLLAHLSEVPKPKIRQAITENLEQLKRAIQLVSFRHDLDLPVTMESLKRRPIQEAETRALFTELEFYRLIGEMPSAPATALRTEATLIVDAQGIATVVDALATATQVGLAAVWNGPALNAEVIGLGLVTDAGGTFFVTLPGLKVGAAALTAAFSRKALKLTAHDAKSLMHVLSGLRIEVAAFDTDVELLSYLLNPSRKEHALADVSRERLRVELPEWKPEAGELIASQVACASADAIGRVTADLWLEIDGMGLGPIAREMEMPLIATLQRMEARGITVDLPTLQQISAQVDGMVAGLLADVYKHAGREFNVGSPAQLSQVLYEDLKLPVLKKGKTGPSTDHEVLEKLAEQHPLPQAIIEYRNVMKLKNTYLDTLPTMMWPDGRIRTTFRQAAAATGRLSSIDPNLQNIPIRSELGKQIRRAFVAEPGWALVSADYSQIELRILAHYANEEALITAFAAGQDVHARTAAEVFGVPLESVTSDQRRAAKMVNYGIAYGLSAHGLSVRLNIPVDEAKGIIERYFARFPGIRGYIDGTIETAKKRGYVESLYGRRRLMPDLSSRNRNIAMGAERAAINMPIQGTAADLVKRAMLVAERELIDRKLSARMLLQVHDELLFECPDAEVEQVISIARTVMTNAGQLKVPLVVDVRSGHSWADAH